MIILIVYLLLVGMLFAAVNNCPIGYEDEHGFHKGRGRE